ncbi:Histidinol dehydrogenase [Archaeoglobus veneficus SNP6]|uniref:Histidinol dehydrogenase n=2 Tax=Archaeoglobus veneficus TaxID=58290 RepID=F2KNN3_ARCVS|nr:Histidinol dehydrogenase [Archaeoglobus veneficus SNP6]
MGITMIVTPDDLLVERSKSIDEYIEKVRPIVEKVREGGDEALIELTKQFDGVELQYIRVPSEEIDAAYEEVDDEIIDALEVAKQNIERFHSITCVERDMFIDFGDVVLGKRYVPLDSAGIYVPGGRASYPSTALMAGIPASIAGVERIAACTPPDERGKVKPLTLVACDIAGINEIYAVGGAQAIAALAYGTESVKPVDKIVGPGNIYVTAAKILVSKDVPIDMPAGPSEVLIIADETANARFVALDALAQLEHDPMAIAVVLTTSEKLAKEVQSLAEELGKGLNLENLRIAVVDSIDEAIEISNKFAPEHLEMMFEGAENCMDRIKHAGSVFVGEYSPVAAGDYASGTNHILPTAGYGRRYSGLSVETFLKHITFQKLSKDGLKRIGQAIITLANKEGLPFHAKSVEERLKE